MSAASLVGRVVHDLPGLVVISIVYGFISGDMVSLPPATIANLSKSPSEYGIRMGMGYRIASIGALIGNPIGGAAQQPSGREKGDIQKEFQGTWIFSGSFMLAAVFMMSLTYYFERRGSLYPSQDEGKAEI